MTSWIRGLLLFTILVRSLLPSSCEILTLKEKRVSLKLVSAALTLNIHFFLTLFPLVEMTTKFNKDMYAKMRAKKDEPLSNIGKKTVRITGRGSPAVLATSITLVASGMETTRTASPLTSIEELPTLVSKRPHLSSKEKEKVDPRTSTIWSDERLAVDRAHGVITAEDLKVFSGVPFNTVASHHIHRLVQVWSSCGF